MSEAAERRPRRLAAGVRWFLLFACLFVVLALGMAAATAAAVYRSGTIAVDMQPEDGSRITVELPAALAHLAIALVPRSFLDELTTELEPALPALRSSLDQIADAPDFVLFELRSRNERVLVQKKSRQLAVHVESGDEQIDVSLPLATVKRLLGRIGARG